MGGGWGDGRELKEDWEGKLQVNIKDMKILYANWWVVGQNFHDEYLNYKIYYNMV